MTPGLRYVICIVGGLLIGIGLAVYTVRSGAMSSNVAIGAWTSGTDFGTTDANAKTRAVVAMRGLLALPAKEARYYNAAVDDAGRPLNGHCRYRVTGGTLPGRWWSLTLYDHAGYLAGDGPYSIESAALAPAERGRWTVLVAPDAQPGHWLPTAKLDRFELTLRIYLPDGGGKVEPARDQLPSIRKEACA